MELRAALASRRMTRSFTGEAVDEELLRELCVASLRAPTAGNAAGVSMVVIGRDRVNGFFTAATDEHWRASAPRAPGLLRAGAVVTVLADPARYAQRYSESDKEDSGLGDVAAWSVPYWHTDAAMAAMALLLLLEEAQLAAVLWGNFRHGRDILDYVGAPTTCELTASILVGHSDGQAPRSASLARATPPRAQRVRVLDSQ